MAALEPHLFASAARCQARGASCEGGYLDRALAPALERLALCRSEPGGEPPHLAACVAGARISARLLAVRPSPTLALDLADALAWIEGAAERARAVEMARSRDRATRAEAARILARPPPPAPPALRESRPIAATTTEAPSGWIDPALVRSHVEQASLARCAAGAAPRSLRFQLDVSADGVARAVDAPACVRDAIGATLASGAEGGEGRVTVTLLFAPP